MVEKIIEIVKEKKLNSFSEFEQACLKAFKTFDVFVTYEVKAEIFIAWFSGEDKVIAKEVISTCGLHNVFENIEVLKAQKARKFDLEKHFAKTLHNCKASDTLTDFFTRLEPLTTGQRGIIFHRACKSFLQKSNGVDESKFADKMYELAYEYSQGNGLSEIERVYKDFVPLCELRHS